MPLSVLARVDAGEAAFAWLPVSLRLFTAACAATIGGDLMREGGSGNPSGEMTDAPTPTRRKSSIIVGRNATSNEKQGDKPKKLVDKPK
jgi:hypothetical protein